MRKLIFLVVTLFLINSMSMARYSFDKEWGGLGAGTGQFNTPCDISVSVEHSFVYVADTFNNRIQKFDQNGNFINQWQSGFNHPEGLTATGYGCGYRIYVCDTGNNCIKYFDENGTYIGSWGTSGTGQGQFNHPTGIAFISYYYSGYNYRIYVVDQGNNRVQIFNPEGVYIDSWGSSGSGNGQFNSPSRISIDPSCPPSWSVRVFVTDTNNNRVQCFNQNGVFQSLWGTGGSGSGQFNHPVGISCFYFYDMYGNPHNVLVGDRDNNRVQRFSTTGSFMEQGGRLGSGPGMFEQPQGVSFLIDYNKCESYYYYVADTNNNRIQKFHEGTVEVENNSLGSIKAMFK